MAFTDQDRICQATTSLGPEVMHFSRLRGREGLSQLYSFEVELLSGERGIEFADLVGQPMCVGLTLPDESPRYFHGIVSSFAQIANSELACTYSAKIVPWMWILTRRSDHRIFQNQTTRSILETVFDEAGIADVKFMLSGSYAARVYCVQYGETDFAFVSRLMEQEGMYYYFTHTDSSHTLVIHDSTAGSPDCPAHASAKFETGYGDDSALGVITAWRSEQTLHSGRFSMSDYNFTDPKTKLLKSSGTIAKLGSNTGYEVYEYPGYIQETSAGIDWTKIRMQEQETAGVRIRGASACRGFIPGHVFKVVEHYRPDVVGQEFLLTEVSHDIRQGTPFEQQSPLYSNTFECVSQDLSYRPVRHTHKPKIPGSQTAVVVGPGGDEIYTDKDGYGQIKVQFHWDRQGESDENSSCWVRVSQSWAGAKWGAVVLPRIGQEVVVTFLEGDPDRPLVTGCVYNADNMPPYELPANNTQSGFKSRSSKGGGKDQFNEIRFEDKAGKEELYFHAEKDHNTVIENDQTTRVEHDQTLKVGHDQTVTIDQDQAIEIKNDRSLTVGASKSESVGKDKKISVSGNHQESIGKDMDVQVSGLSSVTIGKSSKWDVADKQEVSIGKNLEVKVGASQTDTVAKDYQQSAGGSHQVTVEMDRKLTVAKASVLQAKKISLEGDDEVQIVCGKARIVLKKNGDISIEGKKIQIKGSGDLILKGSKIGGN